MIQQCLTINQSCSIAVVGMACTFPGAPDHLALWDILRDGRITVAELPPERFRSSKQQGDSDTRTFRGNFIDDPDTFDNAFFHVSPREAQSMDPQQRLLLRVAYHALENAGYIPDLTPSWNPDTFGTFVGVATNDYIHNLRNSIDVYYSIGTMQSFLSGRLAYAFGFGGPSIVLDTACSSSIVAIHQACRALQNGDCNAALAGGVNIITSPDMYLGLSRGHFLSDDGQCRPWDASASGYGRSEGCGLFVLKRLDNAVIDNDRILAVIRGVEVNQSGNARSITHPHVPTQVALFEKLVASADVDPCDISVAECHGTGTQAGDPAELEAVRKVFASGRAPNNPLHITSIKANIGHAEAASGAASLAKLIMMFREHWIPRHPSFERLNPRIPNLSVDNVQIDTAGMLWTLDRPRFCLLNNFGASGSNSALILEEYVASARTLPVSRHRGVVVGVACKSYASAEKMRDAYVKQLQASGNDISSLHDFAYSATSRRQLHPFRLAVGGISKEEMIHSLLNAPIVQIRPAENVVFVFPGQGSQYHGMAGELYRESTLVSQIVDDCDRKLVQWGFNSILHVFLEPQSSQQLHDFWCTQTTQIALFVLEFALAQLWISWGVRPIAVVGHSFGEFVALVIAGVLSLEDGLQLVATRAQLLCEKCVPHKTSMAGVHASAEQLADLLALFPDLDICCYNDMSHNTVGGPVEQLHQFELLCSDRGYKYRRLDIAFAYHSAAMDPILVDMRKVTEHMEFRAPQIAILSNVYGKMIHPGDTIPYESDYFARHCREPARFSPGILSLQAYLDTSSIAACIEVGPHPTTLSFLRGLQKEGAPLLLPSLRRNASKFGILCSTLAQLYCTSVPVKWTKVFNDLAPDARLVDLPLYPFADTRFWLHYEERRPAAVAAGDISSRDGTLQVFASSEVSLEELAGLIQGHEVAGFPLCPASVYTDLVLSRAIRAGAGDTDLNDLADLSFPTALVYTPGRSRKLVIDIDPNVPLKYAGSFKITSTDLHKGDAQVHCSGFFKRSTSESRHSKFLSVHGLVERETKRILAAPAAETFSNRTVYDLLFPQVVRYSEEYRAIQTITVDCESLTAYAICRLPKTKGIARRPQPSVVNTISVDTLFHVAGFLVNFTSGMNGRDAFICSRVDSVKVPPDVTGSAASYVVYASAARVDDGLFVVDVYAMNSEDSGQQKIVAHLKRAHFRRVILSGFKHMLALASESPLVETSIGEATSSIPIIESSSAPIDRETVQDDILRVISETSNIPLADVSLDAELSKLGIDSLMTWELISRLRFLFPPFSRSLDPLVFANATTVEDLIRAVFDHQVNREAPNPISLSSSTLEGNSRLSDAFPAEAINSGAISFEHPNPQQLDLVESASKLIDHPQAVMSLQSHSAKKPGSVMYSIWRLQSPNDPLGQTRESTLSLNPNQRTPPFFLIHDGTGLIGGYSRLAPLGGEVWAIRNHDFAETYAHHGTHEHRQELGTLVDTYLAMITRDFFHDGNGIEGGCLLGGWSFGGVVAFELARSLMRVGITVNGLILIDAPAPQTSSPLPDEFINSMVERMAPAPRIAEHLKAQMKCATRSLAAYDPGLLPRISMRIPAVYLRSQRGVDMTQCGDQMDPGVRAFLSKEDDRWTVPQWTAVLGEEMEVLDIPGDHTSAFDQQNVDQVSEQLRKAIQILLST